MKIKLYIDTWSLSALMPNSPDRHLITCYGIKNEKAAVQIAQMWLDSKLVPEVEVRHTTKETARARWKTETYKLVGMEVVK